MIKPFNNAVFQMSNPEFCFGMTSIWLFLRGLSIIILMAKTSPKSRLELLRSEHKLASLVPERNSEPIALIYPNEYKVGMASLGFLTTFRLLIENGFRPERFFLNVRDKSGIPVSIESGAHLKMFDILAFHFSYEPDYVNAVSMLIDSGIQINRDDRKCQNGPILIAGGIATTANPLPVASFIDAAFIGETEGDVLCDIHKIKRNLPVSPEKGWFISEEYFKRNANYHVIQQVSPEWNHFESYSPIITSETTFGAMNLIEITRGCPIHCKFCLTGGLWQKVRERSFESIIKSALIHKDLTKRVGLIGAIPSLHSKIIPILENLIMNGMSPSLSSLSVASLKEELIALLAKGGMRTLTLGVESFDEELQDCYGKPVSFDNLQHVIACALKAGFREIKIYLILGLPGSRNDEEKLIVEKITALRNVCMKARPDSLFRVSLNPFVPKVSTKYEKEKFMGESEFRTKINFIRSRLARLGVTIKSESPKGAYMQNLLSRGDEKMGEIILCAAEKKNWKKIAFQLFPNEESYFKDSIEIINKTFLR